MTANQSTDYEQIIEYLNTQITSLQEQLTTNNNSNSNPYDNNNGIRRNWSNSQGFNSTNTSGKRTSEEKYDYDSNANESDKSNNNNINNTNGSSGYHTHDTFVFVKEVSLCCFMCCCGCS